MFQYRYLNQTSSHPTYGKELLEEVRIQGCRHDDHSKSGWVSDAAGGGVGIAHVIGQE